MNQSKNSTEKCWTTYNARLILTCAQSRFLVSISSIIILLAVCANMLVLVAMVKTKQLYNNSLRLIFLLCFSDLLAAAFWEPMVTLLFSYFNDQIYCNLEWSSLFFIAFQQRFSGLILVLLVVDRFVMITFMMRHRQIITQARLLTALVGAAILSLLMALFQAFAGMLGQDKTAVYLTCAIDVSLLTMAITMVLYIKMKSQNQRKKSTIVTATQDNVNHLINTMLFTLVSLYLPFITMTTIYKIIKYHVHENDQNWLEFARFLSRKILFCHTVANPLIFASMNIKTKKFLLQIRNNIQCPSTSQDTRDFDQQKRSLEMKTVDSSSTQNTCVMSEMVKNEI